ncbi:MAG: adenine deaminase [Planctomycetaceae bacterium]|nr:adenine deaminase [Planctomycetaceae bacterium]
MQAFTLRHQVVDLHARTIAPCEVRVRDGRIESITPCSGPVDPGYLVPGFIDAHVHVESSMLPPSEFARAVVVHGTVGTVSDPHEIANVLGEAGVEFMLVDGARRNFHFHFGCPSCVPATAFETAGAALDAAAVTRLLADSRIGYLSEMMNWPGVLAGDAQVLAKIAAAKAAGKPVDGHAPQLMGERARVYAAAGISTDHECVSLDEARGKAALGMHILIREGSAARNFEALWPMLKEAPKQCMFCMDDAHPDVLRVGHINALVARAVAKGVDVFDALRAACVNPVQHYGLKCGLLRAGDSADFALVQDLQAFKVRGTWIRGERVADAGACAWSHLPVAPLNRFRAGTFAADMFRVKVSDAADTVRVRVIQPTDGELVTGERTERVAVRDGCAEPRAGDAADVAFITVVNRYTDAPPGVAFIHGFGLGAGAIAASVAHDCHNVVAVGGTREALAKVVNAVFQARGGLAVHDGNATQVLPLPIAGLMSDQPFAPVAADYERLTAMAHALGSPLRAPFMTLSFMALLVIPALKLSDQGLFDGRAFRFTEVVQGP